MSLTLTIVVTALVYARGLRHRSVPAWRATSSFLGLLCIWIVVKKLLAYEFMPMANMWWAHTLMLTKPIITEAATITGYPKIGFRENTGTISEIKGA